MDRAPLTSVSGGGLKSCSSLQGEICRKKQSRFRLGRLQLQILSFLLHAGLRRFKPAMIPIAASRKEVAEAVARLAKHNIVRRIRHGYYDVDLDRIKQISLRKPLPPIQPGLQGEIPGAGFPPVRGLAPAQPRQAISRPAAHGKSSRQARAPSSPASPPQQPTAQAPSSSPKASSSPPSTGPQALSVACRDKKLSKHVACHGKIGVVIPPGNGMLQEIVYDNVRALSPAGYHHGDKSRLLRAEDLVRFDRIVYAELSVPSYSDYFERWGVAKIYYKCIDVSGYGMLCSDFVEWVPPSGLVEKHGIPWANYVFRHYILPAAGKVIARARQVLARRLQMPVN